MATDSEIAYLAEHGWQQTGSPDGPPAWEHDYFTDDEPFDTETALEHTRRIADRLKAAGDGTGPDELGYPDTYSHHLPAGERARRARAARADQGFPAEPA